MLFCILTACIFLISSAILTPHLSLNRASYVWKIELFVCKVKEGKPYVSLPFVFMTKISIAIFLIANPGTYCGLGAGGVVLNFV